MWLSRSAQTLDVLMAVRWAILEATKQYGLYVIIAEGNHCKVNLENMEGYSHVFSDYENVEVINDFTEIDLSDELSLYVMSYFPESGSFIEKLDSLQQEYDINSQKRMYYISTREYAEA